MDIKRVTSALLGFPLVVIVLILGNKYIVDIFLALVAMLGMQEYFNAVSKESKPVRWIGYLSCLAIALVHIIPENVPSKIMQSILLITIPAIMLILFLHVIITNMKINFKDMAYTLLGICYIPTFIMFLTMIDKMQNGKILLGYIFIASWGTDVFAYSVGCRFGKHKFSKVSPKKSIEGCIAGTIGAVVIALIYTFAINSILNLSYSYVLVIIATAILSVVGQVGDFAASSIKRYADIKDYSNLIPGHGGMLDRIDSLMFLAPFAYLVFNLL